MRTGTTFLSICRALASIVLLLSASVGVARAAAAYQGSCDPSLVRTFGSAGTVDGIVHASAVFDDGSGPALYVGGSFTSAGGVAVKGLAKFDGRRWTQIGDALWWVYSLAVFDDGTGPALYAGGRFTVIGGVSARYIARYDGVSWAPVGLGASDPVWCLHVFDDGTGSALYAGGSFTSAGSVPANRIAKWNGVSWSALGAGVFNSPSAASINCMTTHDDGSGPALFVGGWFSQAGGAPALNLAKWNGLSWSGLSSSPHAVTALESFDDGGGPALFVGQNPGPITRWRAGSSTTIPVGAPPPPGTTAVLDFFPYDDGSGTKLYVGGRFQTSGPSPARNVGRWDGSSFTTVGGPMCPVTRTLTSYRVDGIDRLVAGGQKEAGPPPPPTLVPQQYLSAYSSTGWGPIGASVNGEVLDTTSFFEAGVSTAVIAGEFELASGVAVRRIAKWNGTSWSKMGEGFDGVVHAVAEFDDGSGPTLYAGGAFTKSGTTNVNHIARWNGTDWQPLTTGTDLTVRELAVHDFGSGPALYVGGDFQVVGGITVNGIARWDGAGWSALGSGASNSVNDPPFVSALGSFRGDLIAGGRFSAMGGVPASGIAKWDGAQWSALGVGIDSGAVPYTSHVDWLEVFTSGATEHLYVSGSFTGASNMNGSQRSFVRWNGSSWTAVPWSPMPNMSAGPLKTYDDGSGLALYVGVKDATGAFNGVGRLSNTWQLAVATPGQVNSLDVQSLGQGPSLVLAGDFVWSPPGYRDDYVAAFGGCNPCEHAYVYCVSSTTSSGCTPTLCTSGTPSASATSGFTVNGSNVEGQRMGALFYGVNGPRQTPWVAGNSSFLCVRPPYQRVTPVISGGSLGACDGAFATDLLAFWAANPGALGTPVVAGDTFWAQAWLRDPAAIGSLNLSDGIRWTMYP